MKKWSLVFAAVLLAGCGTQSLVTSAADAYNISLTPLGYEVDTSGRIIIPAVTATLTATAGAHDISDVQYTAVLLDGNGVPAVDATSDSNIVPASGQLFSLAKGGYYCYPYQSGGTTISTPESQCNINNPGYQLVDNGFWTTNIVSNRAIVPGEWAIAHLKTFGSTTTVGSSTGGTSTGGTSTGGTSTGGTSTGGTSTGNTSTGGTSTGGSSTRANIRSAATGGGAAWYAQFTFTGKVNGQVVTWKQNYQFTNPAKAGN